MKGLRVIVILQGDYREAVLRALAYIVTNLGMNAGRAFFHSFVRLNQARNILYVPTTIISFRRPVSMSCIYQKLFRNFDSRICEPLPKVG